MLTIFSIPKAFTDHIATIQLNALQSWTLLKPGCEIILCGDEVGIKEAATEFKVRHLPDIACNEYGTPLLNSAFDEVTKIAKYPYLGYVNADIILLNDFLRAVQKIHFREFLMVGKRHNIDLEQRWDFSQPEWCSQLRKLALSEGNVASHFFIDYFAFTPNGALERLPPFAVGRPRWDNWFVYHARSSGIPVIDASGVVMAIHQNHDYSHIPHKTNNPSDGSEAQWEGPEARRNRKLSTQSIGLVHQFTILDATHVLTSKSLLPAFSMRHIRKRWHSWPVLYPRTKLLVQIIGRSIRPIKRLKRLLLGS